MDATLVWKVRRKHLLIWGVVIAAVIVAVCVFVSQQQSDLSRSELIFDAIAMEFLLLWILTPISVMKTRNGSRVSDAAIGKVQFRGWRIEFFSAEAEDEYQRQRELDQLTTGKDSSDYQAADALHAIWLF
jgi:hypothetical protein